jgi:SAM-dependent methyltransferase
MTAVTTPPAVDGDALMGFVFRAIDEVGASLNCALVVMGDKLGYYRTLAEHGPLTPNGLAHLTNTAEPYAREWLAAQAAGGFLGYDPEMRTFSISPEVAVAMTDATSPAYLPGFFQFAYGTIRDAERIIEAAETGDGVGWHDHNTDVQVGCERFFRPGYLTNLGPTWLPALDGVIAKLEAGARVADIGCGHGSSTVLLAQTYQTARVIGSDYYPATIDVARERAREAGVADRTEFEVAGADAFSGTGYDLVTTFDAVHDMGDPVGAARHVYDALADDGTWMVVEPAAGDHVEDNLTPVGRTYYGFSTLLCTPGSLSQDVGLALGAQAGPARIRDVMTAAGFTRFRIAASSPLNNVFEIRK